MTWDGRVDLDLSAVATCADIVDYLALHDRPAGDIWCGSVRLDPDHRVGVPPLIHGAALTPTPTRPDVCLTDPHLAVVCGPDAGRMVPLTATPVSIGRNQECDLPVMDDGVSHRHASAGFDGATWVRDLGSRNGTQLIRHDGSRSRRRRLRPKPGDRVLIGSSVLELRPVPPPGDGDRSFTPPSTSQLSGIAAGAMTGIVLAVVTGRWYFALLALAYPLTMGVPMLIRRVRRRGVWEASTTPPGDPCPHERAAVSQIPTPRSEVATDAAATLTGPIAVVGPTARAAATARGLLLAQGLRPHDDGWDEPWMRWLPRAAPDQTVLVIPEDTAPPSWARTVVEATAQGCDVRAGTATRSTGMCQVGIHTADTLARRITGTRGAQAMPRDVAWADLDQPPPSTGPGRTFCTGIGADQTGSVTLDLDAHGPHLLVAGTTGSGKSALLETLILGLAYEHSPADLAIALIDFKGGAGLRHCMRLPHVVGCLTDLDRHLAERALVALGAELEHRKRAVAGAGHSSFAEWEAAGDAPPRLLVVADEYQEIAQHHRDFMPHLARLAAQGRSLGLHLVLATQRPAGAVTPEIRANVTTTVALRVASVSESQDLLGSGDAARLPIDAPGRAIIAHGTHHREVQVARPSVAVTPPVRPAGQEVCAQPAELAAAAAARWHDREKPPPLWCEPLPRAIARPATGAALVLGLADWPSQRRQEFVNWEPGTGPLAVVGPRGSGRTEALRLIAAQAEGAGLVPVWLPRDPREAARTVALAEGRDDLLLLIDDAGGALTLLAERDHGIPADLLTRRLAQGAPTALALASHDSTRLAAAAGTRIVLTGPDASDDARWNVPRALAGRPPLAGRGRLSIRGEWCEAQLCQAPCRDDSSHSGDGGSGAGQPLVTPLPTGDQVRALCSDDPLLLGIGGDDARHLYAEPGGFTVVGALSSERTLICAHIERVMSAATPHSGINVTGIVEVREDLLSFPGAPRATGTIVIVRATDRAVRDACGTTSVGMVDALAGPGRVVIVSEDQVYAAQLPC